MRIQKPRLDKQKNEEFFQFFIDFNMLVNLYKVVSVLSKAEYDKLLALLAELDEALELVRTSMYTAELSEVDRLRDTALLGLRNMVKAMQYHFDEAMQKAAIQLMLVFKTYGNMRGKGYAEETGAIFNIVQDFREKYAAEVTTLGIGAWVEKLSAYNTRFTELMNARDKEKSLKPHRRIHDIRHDMEICYGNLIRCIEVAVIMTPEAEEALKEFVSELTSKIERYRNTIAVREGKAAAAKKNSDKDGE